MNIHINIDFDENNNVTLTFDFPIEIRKKFEDLCDVLSNEPFYKGNGYKIDSKIVYEKIGMYFLQFGNNINFEYRMSDIFVDPNNIIGFLKENKNLPITFICDRQNLLTNTFKPEDLPNIKIISKNNNDIIPYKEFYEMETFLSEIINFIKKYNLSPLEQVMLTYDIVKSREYKFEEKDETLSTSRDLSKIVSSNKIVCEGYSNMLNYIFNALGFKNDKIYLHYTDKEEVGHARNYIYLKDDKYFIDSFFILDATGDHKKDENYINNYYYFLKPLKYFNKKGNEIIDTPSNIELLSKSEEEISKLINEMKPNERKALLLSLSSLLNNGNINPRLVLMKDEQVYDELIKHTTYLKQKFNIPLNKDSFKNALYKVRRIEYINNIIKENLSLKDIDKVCDMYYKETPEIRLLKAIGIYEEPTLDKDLKEANATSIEEDLLRMRFLKAIKTKINDLPENEFIKKM